MQSGRQKKKFSQQKKRHHDHIKAKGGAVGPPSSQSKETNKKEKAVPEKLQNTSSENTIAKDQNAKLEKKSLPKANPLGSNWDRYEELDLESTESEASRRANEELFEQRLVQLLNLPIQHVAAPPPDRNNTGGLDPFSGEETASSFLNIDSSALAESLLTLPMHQRLGLDRDFVELCELNALPSNADSSAPISTPQSVDLSMCTTRKKKYTFEFNVPGKTASETSAVDNTSTPITANITSDQISSFESEVVRSGFEREPALVPALTKAVSTPEGDEELEKLLQNTKRLTVDQDRQRGRPENVEVATLPSTNQTQHPTSGANVSSVQDMNTEELDDMLDELLS